MSKILYSFRETSWFTKQIAELLTDEEYNKLRWRLIEFPDAGNVIKGSGGLRKIRQSAKGKGSRGGARVIYYIAVNKNEIFMLDIYAKNEKEDLNAEQIHELKSLVDGWLKT
jgi:mRNA-degrading endonuclease RelE of RelBE toxin-antitoxin system